MSKKNNPSRGLLEDKETMVTGFRYVNVINCVSENGVIRFL